MTDDFRCAAAFLMDEQDAAVIHLESVFHLPDAIGIGIAKDVVRDGV